MFFVVVRIARINTKLNNKNKIKQNTEASMKANIGNEAECKGKREHEIRQHKQG